MKFSLTFFLSSLLLFMVSCSSIPNQNKNNSNINLAIKTSNKNKELIIESLFESNIEFTVSFDELDSYELPDNLINSEMKYFCNSLLQDERSLIESSVFKSNQTKNVLVVYSPQYVNYIENLKEEYPNELFLSIDNSNYEEKIKEIAENIVEQIPSLRAIPNLNVLRPGDATEVAECWEIAIKSDQPTVIALSRQGCEHFRNTFESSNKCELGGYEVGSISKKPDICIISTGSEISIAIDVKNELEKEGIICKVVSMPSFELFEKQSDNYKKTRLEQVLLHLICINILKLIKRMF